MNLQVLAPRSYLVIWKKTGGDLEIINKAKYYIITKFFITCIPGVSSDISVHSTRRKGS
jgi:hypothetical protein